MGNRFSHMRNTRKHKRCYSSQSSECSIDYQASRRTNRSRKYAKQLDDVIPWKYSKHRFSIASNFGTKSKPSSTSSQRSSGMVCKLFSDEPSSEHYILPQDEDFGDLMDSLHYVYQALVGRNHTRIIRNPTRLLDIGTGTGTWLLEMANTFPDCQCVGIDNASIMPNNVVLSNCQFQSMNILNGLAFPDNHFSYLHQRHMLAAIPTDHWRLHLTECYRVAAPNGWLELVETDYLIHNPGEAADQLNALITTTAGFLGWAIADYRTRLPWLMSSVGFSDVQPITHRLPLGDWAPHPRRNPWSNVERLFSAIAPFIYQVCGVDELTLARLLHEAKEEADQYQSYWVIQTVCGRK
ncbi:S-adenosyl-L-methionine-dependent methyltransferase [Syncephalis plumigaleata]|nr:S-adenosyl-L-methionine-dependent methyltransferase [Syncephalis plumigaleata]